MERDALALAMRALLALGRADETRAPACEHAHGMLAVMVEARERQIARLDSALVERVTSKYSNPDSARALAIQNMRAMARAVCAGAPDATWLDVTDATMQTGRDMLARLASRLSALGESAPDAPASWATSPDATSPDAPDAPAPAPDKTARK
jgi:hypothetical protein